MKDREQIVCVIDDDLSARESIVGLGRSAGLNVEAFASAQDYLAARRAAPAACLVLDVALPGLTGLELQALLRREHCDVPIVFVSGHGDVPTSVQALKGGALDFLTKPFDPEVLLSAIRAAIVEASRPGRPDPRRFPERQARATTEVGRGSAPEPSGASWGRVMRSPTCWRTSAPLPGPARPYSFKAKLALARS